jgi:hypothetical protein
MPQAAITARDAMRAAMEAGRYVVGLRKDPRRALAIIGPAAGCPKYACDRPDTERKVRAIVCNVTGDCHRLLGDFRAAAEWYRAAGESDEGSGSAPIYADLVLAHGLADHYPAALKYLRAHRQRWRARPLGQRLYWHLASGWWLYPSAWRLQWRERSLLARLEALAEGNTGSA